VSLTSSEQRVRDYLEPLRSVAPVMRREAVAPAGRRPVEYVKLVAIVAGTFALVALIALLATHRSHPAPAHNGAPRSAPTYLSEGGIAVGIDGGQPPLHYIVDGPGVQAFAWSPDGRRVAYLQLVGGQPAVCYLRVFDTSTRRTRTLTPWFPRGTPSCGGWDEMAWSPDSKSIAYDGPGNQLYVMDLSTRTLRTVSRLRGMGFTWWPGGQLAYPCYGSRLVSEIQWCAQSPGGGRRVLPIRGWDVVWSPASGRVAYLLDPGTPGHYHLQVWETTTDGSQAHLLASVPRECCTNMVPHLVWSPDGTRLAVTGAAPADIIDVATGRVHPQRWWSSGHLISFYQTGLSWRP
jgi:hypothetical protein